VRLCDDGASLIVAGKQKRGQTRSVQVIPVISVGPSSAGRAVLEPAACQVGPAVAGSQRESDEFSLVVVRDRFVSYGCSRSTRCLVAPLDPRQPS